MKSIRTQDAVGHALLHDLVRIVIGEVKDTPFRRGHVITEEDIPKLLDLGKEHIFGKWNLRMKDSCTKRTWHVLCTIWQVAKICTMDLWRKAKSKLLQT